MNKNSLAYAVIFMLVLSAVTTLILAVIDQATRERVAIQQKLAENKAILYSAGLQVDDEEVESIFAERFEELPAEKEIYEYYEEGELVGYVFHWEGALLWGDASGFLGISEDGSSLLGMDVVSNNETPGLGGRITEDWYREQFRGIELSEESPYIIYRPSTGGNVDSITGATSTSESLRGLLNRALSDYLATKGGN